MNQIGLTALLGKKDISDFMKSNWPEEPLVVHDLNETIQSLKNLPFLQSLDSLLEVWPENLKAYLPEISDESKTASVTPTEAKKLFSDKMGLLFNNVQNISPELTNWLAKIKKDLGLPTATYARCIVYATSNGKGTDSHFDQNINFVLQLKGIKKWKLAPNLHVENPTQRYTIGQPVDPELATYADINLPKSMPTEDQKEITLKPGSMLFLPRGYWHSTEAEGDALALNFTFSQPTWADLFLAALRSRLTLSPEWRELADGVNSKNIETREMAEQKFELLLQDLIEDIPHWQASDILASTEGNREDTH